MALDEHGMRPPFASYMPDFRPQHSARYFEGDTSPVEINGQQLATVINFAIRVGQGTETMKNLGALVSRMGVRRTS